MLVKIDKDRIINTDHIVAIIPVALLSEALQQFYQSQTNRVLDSKNYLITLVRDNLEVTPGVVGYLEQILDIDTNYTDERVELSLKSRIAIFLRNSALPMTQAEVCAFFPLDPVEAVLAKLGELVDENVLRRVVDTEQVRYLHSATGEVHFEDTTTDDNAEEISQW